MTTKEKNLSLGVNRVRHQFWNEKSICSLVERPSGKNSIFSNILDCVIIFVFQDVILRKY